MRYIFIIILLALCSCVPPRPEIEILPTESLKEALLEQLSQNTKSFRSLKGLAKMKITAGERTVSGSHALFVEKPASLRAETMSPFGFGLPVMLTATDGRDLMVFIPSEGDYYRGGATPENLMRLFPVPLRVEDLVRFLLYDTPGIAYESVDVSTDGTNSVLTLFDSRGVKQVFRFDGARRLYEVSIYVQDQLLFLLKYSSFEGVPPFPTVASLEMPPQQVKASVVYSGITLNTEIPDEKFLIPLPEGIEEKAFP